MCKIIMGVYVQNLRSQNPVERVQMVKLQNLVTPFVSNVYVQ